MVKNRNKICLAALIAFLTTSSFAQEYQYLAVLTNLQNKRIANKSIAMAPTFDLSDDTGRQTVVAHGTDSIYQGHPTTVLLPNGKSILAVWTVKHGGFCGPMKRSDDGGKTWSELLDVPKNWKTARNCPAIYSLPAPSGKKTLFVFAGADQELNEMHQSYSTDLGLTWSPMKNNGLGPASMPFCTIIPVNDGKKLIAMTNIRRPGEKVEKKSCILVQSESYDGGFTWRPWKTVLDIPGLKVCEPQIIRSPSGRQLLCLIRENAKRTSLYMTSDDEGATWSKPKPVAYGLSGDRHQAKYMADGRLVVVFRDTGKGSPTRNHFVAWVGHYDDIAEGRKGEARFKLLHSFKGGDCGYSGLEVLPDQTLVATTYIKYREGTAQNSVVSVRFKLDDARDTRYPVLYSETSPAGEEGIWETLFDGKSVSKWRGYQKDTLSSLWQIEDGVLTLTRKGGGYIVTRKQYENFELVLDWKIAEGGNSGVLFHVSEDMQYKSPYETGPEVQILDDERHPDAKKGNEGTHKAGANYDLMAPLKPAVKPAGEWNNFRLLVKDGHVQHWLNGIKMQDYQLWTKEWQGLVESSKFKTMPDYGKIKKGHITLQDHGDRVWFKDIRIRVINK
jgi:hypothetical protein